LDDPLGKVAVAIQMLILFTAIKSADMCKTAVFFGEQLAGYSFGNAHPFNSNRIHVFWSRFCALQFNKSNHICIESPETTQEETILRFHDGEYVDLVKKCSRIGTGFLDNGDTPAFKGVFDASSYVVGTSLKALKLVMEKRNGILHAFNPIGGLHHSRRGSAGGFCVFNDIGIIILIAREKYGIKRIAYVDIDAHHGDGVYYEFADDPSLFIADIHEDGRYLYPGTGNESENGLRNAKGTKLNVPLKPGSEDSNFFRAFEKTREFIDGIAKPELIIFQCGADCLDHDPLTHLRFTPKVHRFASEILHQLSHKHSDGRIIALGGGGYNPANVAAAWTEVIGSFIRS
jgi:acetoin utilization protein AcuC